MKTTLKDLSKTLTVTALLGLSLASLAPSAKAAAALIKSGGTDAIPTMITAADGSAVSGLGTAFTVTVRRPGASAYVAGLGTVSENGNGVYDYTPTAAETAAAGSKNTLLVHLVSTATPTTFGDSSAQIVGFDPASATVSLPTTPPAGYGGTGGGGGAFTLTPQNISDIAAAVMASNVDGTLTHKQVLALLLAYSFSPYTRTKTSTSQSLIYQNRAGLPLATSVSGLDPVGNITGRTSVSFSNLPQ